jgi:CheY-specific phosphatase CheX
MKAQLDEQSVIKANAQFWEQMLGMTLEPQPAVIAAGGALGMGHIMGRVQLSGAWRGLIEVRMAAGLAQLATATMMMQPIETVLEADILDAAKEIANMIAGSIKSSLPRPCAMHVPESSVEGGHGANNMEYSLVVEFRHESGGLMVHILEQECFNEGAPGIGAELGN